MSRSWSLAVLMALTALGGRANAQPTAAPAIVVPPGPAAPELTQVPGQRGRSYLQAAMNKIRPGAMLKAEAPLWSPPPELRGRLGRARDEAVQVHYARIAEMDFLADGAAKEHDIRLAERIDLTRRQESQRFFRQMQHLQVAIATFWERRLP